MTIMDLAAQEHGAPLGQAYTLEIRNLGAHSLHQALLLHTQRRMRTLSPCHSLHASFLAKAPCHTQTETSLKAGGGVFLQAGMGRAHGQITRPVAWMAATWQGEKSWKGFPKPQWGPLARQGEGHAQQQWGAAGTQHAYNSMTLCVWNGACLAHYQSVLATGTRCGSCTARLINSTDLPGCLCVSGSRGTSAEHSNRCHNPLWPPCSRGEDRHPLRSMANRAPAKVKASLRSRNWLTWTTHRQSPGSHSIQRISLKAKGLFSQLAT